MYGKLFASMYDGSLATVGPWQALVTFQQLIILADREGYVDMTHEAISRRTIIPLEIIRKGIEELEKPDPQSRDASHDGRRIERIAEHRDWGWKILNYSKYRQIRTAEERRVYMREYMEQKRAKELAAKPQEFDLFWEGYPRKVGKASALKAWVKLSPSKELIAQIHGAVERQSQSEQWRKDGGQFIPHAATWLNQRRWEDEETKIDLGTCKYCDRPAVKITNGTPHCATPRHIDHAQGRG